MRKSIFQLIDDDLALIVFQLNSLLRSYGFFLIQKYKNTGRDSNLIGNALSDLHIQPQFAGCNETQVFSDETAGSLLKTIKLLLLSLSKQINPQTKTEVTLGYRISSANRPVILYGTFFNSSRFLAPTITMTTFSL